MLWHLLSYFNFGALFCVKMGVAATPAPRGLGLQNPTKKLAHVGVLLGHLLSQNQVPKLLDPPPLIAISQRFSVNLFFSYIYYLMLSDSRTHINNLRFCLIIIIILSFLKVKSYHINVIIKQTEVFSLQSAY